MAFNSLEYLFFFLAVLAGSWLLVARPRARVWMILLASFYFYASNNRWLILLLFVCMQVDYLAAKWIEDTPSPRKKKFYLAASMTTNLAMLGFFKYFNFFAANAAGALGAFGLRASWVDWNIVLPLGISFYTFESMSYTIDVYRGIIPAERRWHRFAFFVAYFPHMVAGPILRPREFLPQLDERPRLDADSIETSLFRIAKGLVKKLFVADFLGAYADQVFAAGGGDVLTAWTGVFAFAMQIYYDFSGYTDVAIGCARLMGFTLPENFDRPYAALSVTDFWRRWHMTLSSWLRDYLYIPLGGNRSPARWGVYRNLMLTMTLAGLWHGAAWHFVLFGAFHGVCLMVERFFGWGAVPAADGSLPRGAFLRRTLTFFLAAFGFFFFRAADGTQLSGMLSTLFAGRAPEAVSGAVLLIWAMVLAGWAKQMFWERLPALRRLEFGLPGQAAVYAAGVLLFLSGRETVVKTFIYFHF